MNENNLTKIVSIMLAATAGLSFFVSCGKKESIPERVVSTIADTVQEESNITELAVRESLKNAKELTTLKYLYRSADIYENSKELIGVKLPFTTDMFVFAYDGVINVGIDLDEVDIDVDNDDKEIKIELPEPKILSHEIDEKNFEVRDAKNSILNDTSFKDYTNIITQQKEKMEERLMSNEEYLDNVTENAQDIFEELIKTFINTEGYTIRFK